MAKKKPANDTPALMPEREASRVSAMLRCCARQGIVISAQQLQLLADESLQTISAWVDAIDNSAGVHVPPVPGCLTDYLTRDVQPQGEAGLPPRRVFTCKFGSVSFRGGAVSIPVAVTRGSLTPNDAELYFCRRRLNVVLTCGDADPDQKALPGMEPAEDESVDFCCDVKRFSVDLDVYKFSVSASLDKGDDHALTQLAARSGRIEVSVVGDMAAKGKASTPAGGTHPQRGLPERGDDTFDDQDDGDEFASTEEELADELAAARE